MKNKNGSGYVLKKNLFQESPWAKKQPVLSHLDIELTERCNNNCVHCCINLPENDEKTKKRELSTARWQELLRQAAELGALSVRFTGGEPLLRDDFQEIYLYARRLGLKVILFTNARKITPALAALLARVPPLEKIEVSVYGMRAESYEAVTRVSGSFVEFRRGAGLLLKKKVPFVVKGALLPPMRDEVEEFEAWAATIPAMDSLPTYAMFFDLRGRRDSSVRNRLIKKMRPSPREGVVFLNRQQDHYRQEMVRFCRNFCIPPGEKLFVCGAGGEGCVDAYGLFQPCLSLRAPELCYDLSSGTLKDALLRFFPVLRKITAHSSAYLTRCGRCFLKSLCEQCPAKSWAEHGDLETPVEYCCAVAHEQALDIGLLHKGEKAWQVSNWRQRIKKMTGEKSHE